MDTGKVLEDGMLSELVVLKGHNDRYFVGKLRYHAKSGTWFGYYKLSHDFTRFSSAYTHMLIGILFDEPVLLMKS